MEVRSGKAAATSQVSGTSAGGANRPKGAVMKRSTPRNAPDFDLTDTRVPGNSAAPWAGKGSDIP